MSEHKQHEHELKTVTLLSPFFLDVGTSRELSLIFLRLAKQTLSRCRRMLKTRPIDYLALYILTVVSLEGFINEMYVKEIDDSQLEGKDIGELESLFKNGRILEKWDRFPALIGAVSPFKKGERPWQDFDVLVKLRNDLVHFNPEFRKPTYMPDYLEPIFRIEVGKQRVEQTKPSNVMESLFKGAHWTELICNPAMGTWALNTGKIMIETLLRQIASLDSEYQIYQDMLERLRL